MITLCDVFVVWLVMNDLALRLRNSCCLETLGIEVKLLVDKLYQVEPFGVIESIGA